MPMSFASPSKNSLSRLSWMYLIAAGQALLPLVLLVDVDHRRHGDAREVAARILQRVGQPELGPLVGLGREAPVDVAGADAQLQHHRRVGNLGQLERGLDRAHDRRQVRPRIDQPHLRFHREGVNALLHDRGAFAVVLADDDQRAAGDAAGGEVGERVGGDVGADRGLEGDRAAQRIVHRSRQRGGGGRLAGAVLEMHAEALPGCRWRRPARPSGARSARPGSPRRRTRRTAAAPWSRPGCPRRGTRRRRPASASGPLP